MEICKELNGRGITNRGRRWQKNVVHYLLTNEAYTGTAVWGVKSKDEKAQEPVRVENAWPALVLQRQFKEGCPRMRAKLLGAWRGSAWLVRYHPASPPATAGAHPARTVPGAASPAPPGRPPSTRGQALRPGDPGHLFPPKPAAGSAGRLRPAGTGPRDDASRPRCGSRIRPGPRHSSPSQTPFQCATWNHPRRPGSPRECLQERWTGSSGARCRPGSGSRRPVDLAGLAPDGRPHPLGAELIAAGPLASLGHPDLPPGLRRQFSAALPPWSAAARPRAWAWGDHPVPDRPERSTQAPPATP